MKTRQLALIVFLWAIVVTLSATAQTVPAVINYQGRLLDGTALVNGSTAFRIRLYDSLIGGTLLYEDTNLVTVVDGLYTYPLGAHPVSGNLRDALAQAPVYLEVLVNGVSLSPREQLSSVGYAVLSGPRGVDIHELGDHSIIAGGMTNWTSSGSYAAFIGAGAANFAGGQFSFIGSGYGNFATNNYSTVAGGIANQSCGVQSFIGCGAFNKTLHAGAFIGSGYYNTNSGYLAFIGAGQRNGINSSSGVIGGGEKNNILANHAVIGGGLENQVLNSYGAVCGGQNNQAGYRACVGGGYGNIATGKYAAIAGGYDNVASSNYAFAAGCRAKAVHDGTFVWADSQAEDFESTTDNQMSIRAENGVRIAEDAGAACTNGIGERYRDNGIVAWAKIRSTGEIHDMNGLAAFGVASSTNDSTGQYTITLHADAVSAAHLIPMAIAEIDSRPSTTSALRIPSINQVTSNRFEVFMNNGDGALVDNEFMFMVTGR